MENEKSTLELVTEKIQLERKRGIKFAMMGIPQWLVTYLFYRLVCHAYGLSAEVDAITFLTIPWALSLLIALFIYSPIPSKLGIPPKFFPYFAILLHCIVIIYLGTKMHQEYNGYIIMLAFTNGLMFINHTAGGITTLIFALSAMAAHYGLLQVYGITVGSDEQVFYYFFAATSFSIAIINGVAKKRRMQFNAIKKEVELSHKNLKKMDKFRSKFFKNISHELRTPLTLIINYLSELNATQKSNQLISTSLQSSYKMHSLINQLLDFQRLSKGSDNISGSTVDFTHYLTAATPFLNKACKQKNIKLDVHIQPTKTTLISATIENVEKIVFGLTANAIKHTPENKTMNISLMITEDGKSVACSFKDSGKGFNQETISKYLQDFSNMDTEKFAGHSSIDLGITLIKELIEETGGELKIESEIDKGTEFKFILPITTKVKEVYDILIIDDEENVHALFERLLANELPDIKYKKAHTAEEARELMDSFKFKCVISDVFLPGENGVELLKYIAKAHPGTTRTLLTGHADSDLVKNAVNEFIADLVFYKPWRDAEIVILIKKARQVSKIGDDETIDYSDYQPKDWHLGMLTEAVNYHEDKIIRKKDIKKNTDLVLVVESQPDMRDYIVHTLQKHNMTAIAAGDVDYGVSQARSHKPDIIIVDWVMDEASGPQFIEELNKDKVLSAIPTILLTAQGDDESELIEKESHANAYLGKPFNELELKSTVKNLLELHRANKEVAALKSNVNL